MSTDPSTPTQGFRTTKRQVVLELSLVAVGLAALVVGGLWGVRALAGVLTHAVPHSVDVTLGKQAWAQLAPESRRCTHPEADRYVQALAAQILPHVESDFSFHFTVVDDEALNAFALPGGFVTVNVGLLRSAGSGEEVAGVLAHEIAHVTHRHGTHRVLRQLGSWVILSALFGGTDIETPAVLLGDLINTSYDRDQEAEADRSGLETLRRAGVDPRGMARFFERVSQTTPGGHLPAVLSTHPDPGDRMSRAEEAAIGFTSTSSLPSPSAFRCR